MAARRNTQIIAVAVEIVCPYCGEPVPEPVNGSLMWETYQLLSLTERDIDCDSCEKPIRIVSGTRAQIQR